MTRSLWVTRSVWVVAAAAVAATPLDDYFELARRVWPRGSTAARCLEMQQKRGWLPKPQGSNFKTLGVEGVGHHWLETLPRQVCGGGGARKRCGGQASFSMCGGCCASKTANGRVEYARSNSKARRNNAWRCFPGDAPKYPPVQKSRHAVVLVRDASSTLESILRRFWKFEDKDGARVDTLAREETMLGKALARLEKEIAGLDCRRTLFLSHDHARRAPRAHAAALASFLGASDHRLATFFGKRDVGNVSDVSHREPADCVARVKPWLPRLRAYAAWLEKGGSPRDAGCGDARKLAAACAGRDDAACVDAWRARATACVTGWRKFPTLVPLAPLTTCA